jgi:hypothetical protein
MKISSRELCEVVDKFYHHIPFACGLFNDDVNSSDYIASNDRMNNEIERMCKEAGGD